MNNYQLLSNFNQKLFRELIFRKLNLTIIIYKLVLNRFQYT
jgi:hypothetical protein